MTDPERPDSRPELQIDWDATRTRLRSGLVARLGAQDGALEDLTQQALIEILRLLRREPVRNLGGLIQVVARDTAIDEIRRRQRQRARAMDWDANWKRIETLPDPGSEGWDDSSEILWFLLLEFLRRRQAPCHALARAYAERGDWKLVAEALGQGYDATRQQWSRCVRAFRVTLKKDPGPFKDWLDGA